MLKPSAPFAWPWKNLQPATPLQTDNNTASGIINDTIKQKQSKLWMCISAGFKIANNEANFLSFGTLA